MYAYEVPVPRIQLGISNLALNKISKVDSAKEFANAINDSVTGVNKMIDVFDRELDDAILVEKLTDRMRDSSNERDSVSASNQLALLGDTKNKLDAALSKEDRNLAQLENFGSVLSAINESHNIISAAVTNMSKRVTDLFKESDTIYQELLGLTKLTAALYRRIISLSAKLEIHYLAAFSKIREGNDAALATLTDLMGGYYALSVSIVNKYSYEDADIQATLKLDALDINAYYKDLLDDVYDSKDSFMDFSKAWTNTAGDSLDRFLDADRQFNTKNLISITTICGLIGAGLGYKFARKWRNT